MTTPARIRELCADACDLLDRGDYRQAMGALSRAYGLVLVLAPVSAEKGKVGEAERRERIGLLGSAHICARCDRWSRIRADLIPHTDACDAATMAGAPAPVSLRELSREGV